MMNIDLVNYCLPPKYTRNGSSCFLDPIREKLIQATPEEHVRQQVLEFLIQELNVPQDTIDLEVPMSHFKKGARGRADIIVYGVNEKEDCYDPVLVMECKAPDIALIDRHYDQVYAYNQILKAGTIVITNGCDFIIETYDHKRKSYQQLKNIPSYTDLISRTNLVVDDSPAVCWTRPAFCNINDPTVIQEFKDYQTIGDDTDRQWYPFIINLAGFLDDESWELKPQILNGVHIIKDGGLRYTTFNNTGGSLTGDYRYFIIEDDAKNNQIISLRVEGLEHLESTHPRCPNQKGNTHIVVAIDDYEKSQWLLQVCIDKHIQVKNERNYIIRHDCSLTCGAGACKRSEVRDYVKRHAPELLDKEGMVYLGTLDNTREITWKQSATQEFLGRLIKYALVRDKFRELKRRELGRK